MFKDVNKADKNLQWALQRLYAQIIKNIQKRYNNMPNIQGKLMFEKSRNNNTTDNSDGIQGIPIVVQAKPAAGATETYTVVVKSNENGDWTVRNLPSGDYSIIEYYNYPGAPNATDVDYSSGSMQPIITSGVLPPIDVIPESKRPSAATELDQVSEIVLNRYLGGGDIKDAYIRNGFVYNLPKKIDSQVEIGDENFLKGLDGGTFGSVPPGTPPNTAANEPEYSNKEIGTAFSSSAGIDPGTFSVQNTLVPGDGKAWWRQNDHTSGNETGRAMYINGSNPGQSVLEQTIDVQKNQNYVLSAWISNIVKVAGMTHPQLRVQILPPEGNDTPIYDQPAGKEQVEDVNLPKWSEFGAVFNSGDNTSLRIRIVSEADESAGNDYAIDDISVNSATLPESLKPEKSADVSTVAPGGIVTYTAKMKNTYDRSVTNVFFKDNLPAGMSFEPNSVTIDGVQNSGNPTDGNGLKLPDLAHGQEITITFKAKVSESQTPGTLNNTATTTYDYQFLEASNADDQKYVPTTTTALTSDEVPVTVGDSADIAMSVTVDKDKPKP